MTTPPPGTHNISPQSHPHGWTQPPGAPAPIPPGWPGRAGKVPADQLPSSHPKHPNQRRRRAAAWAPGKWRWMDLVTVLVYVLIMFVGLSLFVLYIPGLEVFAPIVGMTPDTFAPVPSLFNIDQLQAGHLFMVNLINYSLLFALTLLSCWNVLVNGFKFFKTRTVLKILGIPVLWFTGIILGVVVSLLMGLEYQTSQNQEILTDMMGSVPIVTMFISTAIFGPLVEEYLYRHLMVGKLSRLITIWAAAPLSVVVFAAVHFIGDPETSLASMFSYLVQGLVFTLTYIFTKFNLTYVYLLHLWNNAVAVLVGYSVFGVALPISPLTSLLLGAAG